MKIVKTLIAVFLWIGVIGLGFWLYRIIQDPVEFEKAFKINEAATITRLEDIRKAQTYYLEAKGQYANDWDNLINTIKMDSLMSIKTFGDPDDTTIVTTYDTIYFAIKDTIKFEGTSDFNNLRYIPNSGGEEFSLESDILKIQRVSVPVYEVIARKEQYLKGLKEEYVSQEKDLVLGSLTEATESGSWE